MKAAAAAVVLASSMIGGIAHATIDTTAGELVLSVWDPVTLQTYTRDLGITVAQWNATGFAGVAHTSADQVTFGAGGGAADTNWSTFFKAADQAQLVWDIVAGSAGRSGADLLTSNAGLAIVSTATQNNATGANTLYGTYAAAANVLPTGTPNFSTHGTALTVNGSSICADQTASCSWNNGTTGHGGGTLSNLPFDVSAGIGQSLAFYQITRAATPLYTQYAGTFSLGADGALSYTVAAVPEPGTWAMLAAGLLTVGAIARRRIS